MRGVRLRTCQPVPTCLQELQFDKIVRFFGAIKRSTRCFWICMEYMPFGDLRKILHSGKHRAECRFNQALLTLARRLKWAKDVVAALDLLHSRYVVHRDLKPGNVLISNKYDAVLSDFGLSRVREAQQSRLQVRSRLMLCAHGRKYPNLHACQLCCCWLPFSYMRNCVARRSIALTAAQHARGALCAQTCWQPAAVKHEQTAWGEMQASGPGTVSYAAPEALMNNQVSPASDMFSFGCVLWELLSLKEPWAELGGQAFQIMSKLINDKKSLQVADIPEHIRAQIPDAIASLEACFSYEPAGRPSAMAMYDVLDQAIENL